MDKIAFFSTTAISAKVFLTPHFKKLSKKYEITLFSNFEGSDDKKFFYENGVSYVRHIPINRDISLISDLFSLLILCYTLFKHRFDCFHSITPKAGLIGMLASKWCFVPIRIHTFTGQVWITKRGLLKIILRFCDKLIELCSTKTLADSDSQAEFLLNDGICKKKPTVLGKGSICGVDIDRFAFEACKRSSLRKQLGINDQSVVFIFVGRVCQDKGINELMQAFVKLRRLFINAHLLIVGPYEGNFDDEYFKSQTDINIHRVGYVEQPELYYSAADVFILPSYREGFGTSVLEAAASGLPAIATNIYGLSDAVINGETGILVKKQSIVELEDAMIQLMEPIVRNQLGFSSYLRVCKYFSQDIILDEMMEFYSGLDN